MTRIGRAAALAGVLACGALAPAAARAQWLPGSERTTAARSPIDSGARAPEPQLAAVVLAHPEEVRLTTAQSRRLTALAARLDSVTTPLAREIDDLAPRGTPEEWQSLTPARRDMLREQSRRRSTLIAVLHDERRRARDSTLALLTEPQRAPAMALERSAREAAEAPLRQPRNGGWLGGAMRDAARDATRDTTRRP